MPKNLGTISDPKDIITKEYLDDKLSGKVDKIEDKGLSTNDYTTIEKTKLAGIDENANNYIHPVYTESTEGLHKFSVDTQGHVNKTSSVVKEDIVNLGIPAQDTTYEAITNEEISNILNQIVEDVVVTGKDGVGIQSITFVETDSNGGNVYKVNLTNGTWYNFTAPQGSIGPQGPAGSDASVTTSNIKTALGYTPGMVNPNLLDNWYFANPVNQRGFTSGNTNGVYTIDRWAMRGMATVSAANGVLSVGASDKFHGICQSIENGVNDLRGKTVTLSAIISNFSGTGAGRLQIANAISAIYVGTTLNYKSFTGNGLVTFTFDIPDTLANNYLNVFIDAADNNNVSFDVVAVKLELGSQQTLAHQENGVWVLNEIPNYEEQLRRCQRYGIPIMLRAIFSANILGTNDVVRFFVPTPVQLRAVPSISGITKIGYAIHSGTYNANSFTVTTTYVTPSGVVIEGTAEWPSSTPNTYSGGTVILLNTAGYASADL